MDAPTNLLCGIIGSHPIASHYSRPTLLKGVFASTNLEKIGLIGNYCMTTRKSNPHLFSALSIFSWSTAILNSHAAKYHRLFVFCKPRYHSISSLAPLVNLTPLYGSTFPVLAPVISSFVLPLFYASTQVFTNGRSGMPPVRMS